MVLNPKPKFAILANFGSLLNLVLPNLDRSRRQLSKNTKIVKFEQNLVPKFLISQILRVLGSQNRSDAARTRKKRSTSSAGRKGWDFTALSARNTTNPCGKSGQSVVQIGNDRPGYCERAQSGHGHALHQFYVPPRNIVGDLKSPGAWK